jgi:lysophospholipid acyltransferase (LPLAT)-like uncharacterized protein
MRKRCLRRRLGRPCALRASRRQNSSGGLAGWRAGALARNGVCQWGGSDAQERIYSLLSFGVRHTLSIATRRIRRRATVLRSRLLKRVGSSESAQWFLSAVGAGYVLAVRWTSRIERQPPPSGGPFIVALWHGQLVMLHQLRFGDHALVALVSDHRDGQLISKCAWHFNIRTVSASTGRSGIVAVRQLFRLAREGHNLFITPDGPRGPRLRVKKGIIDVARLSGLPILPAAIGVSRSWKFNSWDRLELPSLFSRIAVRLGTPIYVSGDGDITDHIERLEGELTLLQHDADRAVDRRTAPG